MDGINASVSGMQTAAKRQHIIANNIANLGIEGYQAKRAINGDSPTFGADIVEIQTSEAPAPPAHPMLTSQLK